MELASSTTLTLRFGLIGDYAIATGVLPSL